MKTAISIPTATFREAERTAKRLKVSRSELYRRALEAFMSQLADAEVTASYNEAFASLETPGERKFRRAATRHALNAIEWKE